MALSAKEIRETTRWQDLTEGLSIYEPATSKGFLTGEWRTDTRVVLSLIHISESTRPLYISYAVFCLKKKIKNTYMYSAHP